MKKIVLFMGSVSLLVAGCFLTTSPMPTLVRPEDTRAPVITERAKGTPAPEKASRPTNLAATQIPALPCETHTATVEIDPGSDTIHAGDLLTVTVGLINKGCVALGLPQYRLIIHQLGSDTVLAPASPDPILHSYGVGLEQTDTAVFVLTAIREGEIELTGTASFEVHLGYPGPAYWGSASSGPVNIQVEP